MGCRVRFCKVQPASCSIFRQTRRRICRREFNGADGRLRFCRNATDDLRHFSAGGQICCGYSTAWPAASCFAETQPASREIFRRARGMICRGDLTAWTSRLRFCRSATGGLQHLSAGGRVLASSRCPFISPPRSRLLYRLLITRRLRLASCGILSFRLEAAPFGFVPQVIFIVKVIAVHRRAVFFHFLLDE